MSWSRGLAGRPTVALGSARPARGTLVVAYCGRGAVVWRAGRLRYAGPRDHNRRELERAVEALMEMEGVDLSSAEEVRSALLTIAGARLLRDPIRAHPLIPSARASPPRTPRDGRSNEHDA